MISALVLSLALGADSLAATNVGPLKLKAPTQWQLEESEDGSKSWTSQDQKGAVSVTAGKLDKPRPPDSCVTALTEAVGKEGFENSVVGGQPAAKKITTDFVADKEEDKTEENKVITTTWVGCDGRVKWLLTFTARKSEAARFGPLLKRMLDSISYGK